VQHKQEFFRTFDAVVARSVSNLSNLIEWGIPFLKKQFGINSGVEKVSISVPSLITFKGGEIVEEEQTAKKLYPNISFQSVPLVFPGSEEFDNLDKKLIIATMK